MTEKEKPAEESKPEPKRFIPKIGMAININGWPWLITKIHKGHRITLKEFRPT